MKIRTFIDRPILAGVISVVFLIIGLIGLSQLPVEQFPEIASYRQCFGQLYWGQCGDSAEKCSRTVGGSTQWSGEYDVHDFHSFQYRGGKNYSLFPARNRPRYGNSQCAEPYCYSPGLIAGRSDPKRYHCPQTSDE